MYVFADSRKTNVTTTLTAKNLYKINKTLPHKSAEKQQFVDKFKSRLVTC